jgi:hypothetical protein
MTRNHIYSSSHDKDNKSKAPKISYKAIKTSSPQTQAEPPKELTPSDETRQMLREAQVLGMTVDEMRELRKPQRDFRRVYKTQEGQNFSEPRQKPPRHDLRRPNVLPGDKDFKEEYDRDLVASQRSVIAEIPVEDTALIKFDNVLSATFSQVKTLVIAANALNERALRDQNQEVLHHVEQIKSILDGALQPWLLEIDSHFDAVLNASPEVRNQVPKENIEDQDAFDNTNSIPS